MKYALYEAKDLRNGQRLLWLHDKENSRVATFCTKWALSRIQRKVLISPDSVIWEHESTMITFADLPGATHIDSWGG